MNTAALIDVDMADAIARQAFVDQNALQHETFFNTILGVLEITIEHYPLWDMDRDNKDWLFLHDREHKAECAVLGLPTPPDLDQVDLKDDGQVKDWLYTHFLLHDLEAQALGV